MRKAGVEKNTICGQHMIIETQLPSDTHLLMARSQEEKPQLTT